MCQEHAQKGAANSAAHTNHERDHTGDAYGHRHADETEPEDRHQPELPTAPDARDLRP